MNSCSNILAGFDSVRLILHRQWVARA